MAFVDASVVPELLASGEPLQDDLEGRGTGRRFSYGGVLAL
jgi:hypothetical protein